MGALLLTISPDSDPSKSKAVTALKEAFADNVSEEIPYQMH